MSTPAGNCACYPFQQNCCTRCDSQVSCEMASCNLLSASKSCVRFTHVLHQFFYTCSAPYLHTSCIRFTHVLHQFFYTCPAPYLHTSCIRFTHVLHQFFYTCPAPYLHTSCIRFTHVLHHVYKRSASDLRMSFRWQEGKCLKECSSFAVLRN